MAVIIRNSAQGFANINNPNYLSVTATFSSTTWNEAGAHEVFDVTGIVRLQMWVECTVNVGSAGGTATLEFGHSGDTDLFIAATDETELDAGDLWYDATPTLAVDASSTVILDYVDYGLDVGYTIGTEALNAGALIFHCVWEALSPTGSVVAGTGVAL